MASVSRTRIKICGVRELDTALVAAEAGADAIGLVFARESPRYIPAEEAHSIWRSLPPFIMTVGVVRDLTVKEFDKIWQVCPASFFQFHGNEDVQTVVDCGPFAIKAIAFDPATIRAKMLKWASVDDVAALLIDAPSPGAGQAFDWKLLAPCMDLVTKPIILAGGLTPTNVGDAIRTLRPFAVDVSSGVESGRGVKDPALIRAFCDAVRQTDSERWS